MAPIRDDDIHDSALNIQCSVIAFLQDFLLQLLVVIRVEGGFASKP